MGNGLNFACFKISHALMILQAFFKTQNFRQISYCYQPDYWQWSAK